jgi:hypothetical protein
MRSIDAAVLMTDSVCFERIGDFENSSTATATRNLRTMADLRWRPTSKLAYATRKARGSAGQKLILRKVRRAKRPFVRKQHPVTDKE